MVLAGVHLFSCCPSLRYELYTRMQEAVYCCSAISYREWAWSEKLAWDWVTLFTSLLEAYNLHTENPGHRSRSNQLTKSCCFHSCWSSSNTFSFYMQKNKWWRNFTFLIVTSSNLSGVCLPYVFLIWSVCTPANEEYAKSDETVTRDVQQFTSARKIVLLVSAFR